MTTLARIDNNGIVQHFHPPYGRWNWPWEQHRIANSHRVNDAEHPIWQNMHGRRITPTAEMEAEYARAIRGPTHAWIEWNSYARRGQTRGGHQVRRNTVRNVPTWDYLSVNLEEEEASQTPTTYAPYTPTIQTTERRFGVEIECISDLTALIRKMQEHGIEVYSEQYNHVTRNYWKIVGDGSLRYTGRRPGFTTMELVSPPLQGREGMRQLQEVCTSLREMNSLVNRTCGLHVHHDAAGINLRGMKAIANNYYNVQKAVDRVLSPSRRAGTNNGFCNPLDDWWLQDVMRGRDLRSACGSDRYRNLNLSSYNRHGTVEFRHHQGTIEFDKIASWIQFGQYFVNHSISTDILLPNTEDFNRVLETIQAPDALKTYYARRLEQLGTAMLVPEHVAEEVITLPPEPEPIAIEVPTTHASSTYTATWSSVDLVPLGVERHRRW